MMIPFAYRPSWLWYQLRRGVRNVVRWAPVIWNDEDCDWSGLAWVMEWKLRRMADCELHSYHTTALRDRKQLLTCAELLKRMNADEYFENAGYRPETWHSLPDHVGTRIVKHSMYMAQQDQRYLGLLIGKYLQNWWS